MTRPRGPLLVLLLVAASCHPPTVLHRFDVLVSALTDDGEPVAGAEIELNGRALGATHEGGGLAVTLAAYDGKIVRLHAECPKGFRTRGGDTQLTLQHFATGDPRAQSRLHVAVQCRAMVRRAAVLVRGQHPNLPVLKRGVEIARTDEHGLAHVMVSTPPHAHFQLTLDTSQLPRLRPRNPSATFVMDDSDRVFVFDQTFDELPVKVRPHQQHKAPAPTGPVEFKSVDSMLKIQPWHPRPRAKR